MPKPILDNNFFIEHLVKINATKKVISSEDILNYFGLVIVKKDTEINQDIANRLAKHRLKKSISMSINIENILDERAVFSETQYFIKEHAEILEIQHIFELKKKLQIGCLYAKQFPQVMLMLTVMQLCFPNLFKKTIIGAWFSLAIADQLNFDTRLTKRTYLAALIRDFGLMFVAPGLLEQSKSEALAQWKLIKSHVMIGKLICDEISELPKLVKIAMLEHHERCDGAGYPKAKQLNELSESGQIVAMSDDVQAIYLRRFHEKGHNIANLQGFLALNMTTYSEPIYQAMVRLIRASGCEPTSTVDRKSISGFIDKLNSASELYLIACTTLSELLKSLNANSLLREERTLVSFIERIIKMQISTGVPSEEYARWMLYVQHEKVEDSYPEMEMTALMFEELAWQFGQIRNHISAIRQNTLTNETLRSRLEGISSQLEQAINSNKLLSQ